MHPNHYIVISRRKYRGGLPYWVLAEKIETIAGTATGLAAFPCPFPKRRRPVRGQIIEAAAYGLENPIHI